MKRIFAVITICLALTPALAQQRSAKRGVCWDEKTQQLTDAPIQKMAPGVAWLYNWGTAPVGSPACLGQGDDKMAYLPMCWNGGFDETALRQYLSQHQGEVQYLLAFNEPNLSWNVGGSQMTPQEAATAWPKVKQVAQDYQLEIVAPALNFTGDKVGDRVWEPFAWYDEFFRLVPDAGVDYLCFHSYMNWYSAVNWVASEYFYTDKESSDLFAPGNKAKYPHLVKYLEDYKTVHGHFPRMFLTEFCAWEGNKDGYTSSVDSQIDQLTQKVQKLEQSDLVAGYAWFMANTSQAPTVYPYNSIFQSNTPSSELSDLGLVYVYMSSFDTSKFYAPGETILAKDYVDASTDGQQVRLRPNTESSSTIPLQVEWCGSSWMAYQVDVPEAGNYQMTLHAKSAQANNIRIYRNALGAANKLLDATLSSTSDAWGDVTLQLSLPVGRYSLLLYNMSSNTILLNSLSMAYTTGISHVSADRHPETQSFLLSGIAAGRQTKKGIIIRNGKKLIITNH